MKIVIAPDSFKECLTAAEVANAIETGFRDIFPDAEYMKVPVADGGEGTLQSLIDATGGRFFDASVIGPLGQPVNAQYGILGDHKTAVIEMAQASGIELIAVQDRNPLITTTYGTGQLIAKALEHGVSNIIVGLGGSATNDGGAGMMQALGAQCLDKNNNQIAAGGAALQHLMRIDPETIDPRLESVKIIAACDVDNPLTGQRGATAIFGPQKGATPGMVEQLDKALKHYAKIVERDLGVDVESMPGAGAAGGMGAALLSFMQAELKPGIDIVIDAVKLREKLRGADLVITGEGRVDGQTAQGKTPIGVARAAKVNQLPVIALVGSVGGGAEAVYAQGIDALFSVVHGAASLSEVLAAGEANLIRSARNLAATLQLSLRSFR